MLEKYKSIIDLPHHESLFHKRMTMEERAFQFGSFAALVGYKEELKETGRETTLKQNLSFDDLEKLNYKLHVLEQNIKDKPFVKLRCFEKDNRKEGGKVLEKEGHLIKIDQSKRYLLLEDKTKVLFDDILDILTNLYDFYA